VGIALKVLLSMKAPGSPSSALQMIYFLSPGPTAEFPFEAGENLRALPLKPELETISMTFSGVYLVAPSGLPDSPYGHVFVYGIRIDDAAVPQYDPFLFLEEGVVFGGWLLCTIHSATGFSPRTCSSKILFASQDHIAIKKRVIFSSMTSTRGSRSTCRCIRSPSAQPGCSASRSHPYRFIVFFAPRRHTAGAESNFNRFHPYSPVSLYERDACQNHSHLPLFLRFLPVIPSEAAAPSWE